MHLLYSVCVYNYVCISSHSSLIKITVYGGKSSVFSNSACKLSHTLQIHTSYTSTHTHTHTHPHTPTHPHTTHHTHTPHSHRAEVSSEDDLSPDTDSDSMEVDITPTREIGEASTPVRVASNQDNKSGDKSIGSALVPEVQPHFAVSIK